VRVLHLPYNIASQVSVTVRALREIGIEARGLVLGKAPIQDPTGIEEFQLMSRRRHPLRGTLQTMARYRAVLGAIRWADVVHWHFGFALRGALDVKYAARLGKAGIIEFWGSDIRMPEVACADNPYLAMMYDRHPEFIPRDNKPRTLQAIFAKRGFSCLIPGNELDAYVQKDLFPGIYHCEGPLLLSEFDPKYPDPANSRPLVTHSPSSKPKKGTDAVLRAVEDLSKTHAFEFRLLHGVHRSEALAVVRGCDIFLDQFVYGAEGFASLEAMALGKPTVCYIKPSLLVKYPPDLPIVVADQDNLTEVIKGLLEDGQRRYEIGRRSRAYVEEYHDAHKIARELVAIYERLLGRVRK